MYAFDICIMHDDFCEPVNVNVSYIFKLEQIKPPINDQFGSKCIKSKHLAA